MDNVFSTLPLLRLPKKAVLNTFRVMGLPQIFGISLLSKKTKNLVESLNMRPRALQVFVGEIFYAHVHFSFTFDIHIQLYRVKENRPLQKLGTPPNFRISNQTSNVRCRNSLSIKQLLDHLKFIFHRSITTLIFKENYERFSLESVFEHVKGFKGIAFSSGNHELNRKVLNLFNPASIDLEEAALIDGCVPRYMLIHNLDLIRVSDVQNTLNDLLITNARLINFTFTSLSWKILNRFLKLWVKGSNPRMEFALLQFPGNIQLEELFSGLKYQNASPRRVRLFKATFLDTPYEVIEGRDIWRLDGTQATILVDIMDDLACLRIFVWHDHCVVN